MKINVCTALLVCLVALSRPAAVQTGEGDGTARLVVDASKRYLQYEDGRPFLYLGDTAWEMFARLTCQDAGMYLENRRMKGFTVIQSVILTELDGLTQPTACGAPQLESLSPLVLHPAYLQHVDSIIRMAGEKGLFVALLPTWGDKVDKQWGEGPELFDEETASEYGRFLGRHYAGFPNIIWVIGGDRSGEGKNKAVWNAMANGIKECDKNHLMTYHPQGEHSSSFWFHHEPWLDFNMFQSGHCQSSYEIYRRLLLPDLALEPRKPVMDGEPRYEDIPVCFKPENGRFAAYDVRKSLYQSMLSGACGYTYGCNNVWQMYDAPHEPKCNAHETWRRSLDMEGASQLVYFRRLWETYPFAEGQPCRSVIEAVDDDGDAAVAFGNEDYMICYFPEGRLWHLDLGSRWAEGGYSMQWMDPSTGIFYDFGEDRREKMEIAVPAMSGKRDWVLVIKKK